MRYLLFVKGDGRGHLTQALTLYNLLESLGHHVPAVIVGAPQQAVLPRFIFEKAPTLRLQSPNLLLNKAADKIHWGLTTWTGLSKLGVYNASLQSITALVAQYKPDVLLNLYEPLLPLYALRYGAGRLPPVVHLSHQALMLHGGFTLPAGRRWQRNMVVNYSRLLTVGAVKSLGLSFYELPDDANRRIIPVAPLLRQDVFERSPTDEGHYLFYMVYHGLAEQLKHYNLQHPEVPIHAFWNRPDAPPRVKVTSSLTFHQVNDVLFLDMLASSRGVGTTAGFETVCEAFYYRKPAILFPMPGQYEQYINAHDAEKVGAGQQVTALNPALLTHYLPHYLPQHNAYLNWLQLGRAKLIYHLQNPTQLTTPTQLPAQVASLSA